MSIQTIIDKAQQIEIDRRRMVGQTISRSQRLKTAERSTAQPWKFKVTPPGMLPWAESRSLIETIDSADRVEETEVSLSNVAGMQYITEYRGQLNKADIDAMTIYAVGTDTLTLTTLPAVSSSTVIFAKGDYIQPANSRYPYTVAETCTRGTSTTTSVTLHRNVITSEGITLTGQHVNYGNTCTWRLVVSGLPSYQLVPGKFVQYTGDFELIEKIV